MLPTIAFVGAGPTTIYTLHALANRARRPFAVTIFEEQAEVGRGTPYRPGWNDPAMLSNIASIEIPTLEQTLVDWLRAQPEERLARLAVDPDTIDDRTFYPRLTLGEYFADQLDALLDRMRAQGAQVITRTRCHVRDALSAPNGMILTVKPHRGAVFEEMFDHVVLATGHQWPDSPEARPGYFISPWPASELQKLPPSKVGIRGSSLTAIDAAVALSVTHGDFIEEADGTLRYEPKPGTDAFHLMMISRKGLLPEADFYAPLPYEPLSIFTPEAMEQLIDQNGDDLLEKAFALFKEELIQADPEYAKKLDIEHLGLEDFCDRYFADREASDPFDWADSNLKEAQANYEAKTTIAWRYAILRMHEVMALAVPHFNPDDYKRFARCLKQLFIDDYATVPHESIKRMLALHRAGKLDVLGVGEDYSLDSHAKETGAVLHVDGEASHFPVFIEAMGQRALKAKDFPFPSLIHQGIIRDNVDPEAPNTSRGLVIDDEFHPISNQVPLDQLFCLSLPFILGRHPFIQGITSSHEIGLIVGEQLADAIDSSDMSAKESATEIST